MNVQKKPARIVKTSPLIVCGLMPAGAGRRRDGGLILAVAYKGIACLELGFRVQFLAFKSPSQKRLGPGLFRVALAIVFVILAAIVFRILRSLEIDNIHSDTQKMCSRTIEQIDAALHNVPLGGSIANDENC